jgi:hypothetical protein
MSQATRGRLLSLDTIKVFGRFNLRCLQTCLKNRHSIIGGMFTDGYLKQMRTWLGFDTAADAESNVYIYGWQYYPSTTASEFSRVNTYAL